ncbi:MAG: hypothetical protein FJZ97_01300 [Chloroflexi bacterium]|nr:hypothetical protein [Chloroflexota bacterium]
MKTVEPVETVAAPSQVAELELTGTVESMAPTAWMMNGKVLAILPATEIKGTIQVGDLAKAHAFVQADGTLAARQIEPAQPADAAQLSLAGAEYDFTGAVEAIAIDQCTVAGKTFAVTAQTEIKGTFSIGELVKIHLLVGVDGSLVAREIESPEAELEDAMEGAEVELVAMIDSMAPEAWIIGGRTVAITAATEVKGVFTAGQAVKVHLMVGAGGALTAREIEAAEVGELGDMVDDNANVNSNLNSNANSNENGNGNENGNSNGNDNSGNDNDDDSNSNGSGKGDDNGNGNSNSG